MRARRGGGVWGIRRAYTILAYQINRNKVFGRGRRTHARRTKNYIWRRCERAHHNDRVAPALLCAYNNIYNNEMSRTGTQYDLRAIYSVPRPSADLRSPHPPQKTISPPPGVPSVAAARVYNVYAYMCGSVGGRMDEGGGRVDGCACVCGAENVESL